MRALARLAVVALSGVSLLAPPASAVCPAPFGPLPDHYYSNPVFVDPVECHLNLSATRPYWVVVAAQQAFTADTSDYDVALYQNISGGAAPVCFSGLLAVSARTGSTDFVVGDFNHNPYGTYYARVNCYSGACATVAVQWRDGGTVLTVNGAPLTVDATFTQTYRQLVNIYDVYLNAGTTYRFNFQSTGDLKHRMLLFRNPTGGTYWAGRNDAAFEVAGCTSYTAPTSGYYGLVVVADAQPSQLEGHFSVSVTTAPVCSCPTELVSSVPVTTSAGPVFDHRLIVQPQHYWSALGLRSDQDWDVYASSLVRAHPNVNCADSLFGQSAQSASPVEVLVSDGNHIPVPDTLHVTSATFASSPGASLEYHKGGQTLAATGFKVGRFLGADDRVEAWDMRLLPGKAYHMNVTSFGPAVRAMLFRDPGSGRYVAGRDEAVFSTTDTATYVAPANAFYGFVLVHEDAVAGGVSVTGGVCDVKPPIAEASVTSLFADLFTSLSPTLRTWTLAVVLGEKDYDLELFSKAQGPGYPACFDSLIASSNGSGTAADFIVGDLRGVSPRPWYVRAFDFAPGNSGFGADLSWFQARVPIGVNAPPVSDDLGNALGAIHEATLHAGVNYTLQLTRPVGGTQQAFVLAAPAGGGTWQPRSMALASTGTSVSFTAPYTGSYAVVVVNEDYDHLGTTQLAITGPVAGIDPVPAALHDALRSAGANPSRGAFALRFELAREAGAAFELLDVSGRRVAHATLGTLGAGVHERNWQPEGALAPGVYLLRYLVDGRSVEQRRVVIAR